MTTENRTIEIVARVKDFASSALRKIGTVLDGWAKRVTTQLGTLVKSIASMRAAFTLLVGGFAAFRGGSAVVGIVKSTDELNKLAKATGGSVEELSVLQQAFGAANLDAQKFRQTANVLSRTVGTALNNETSKAALAFQRLGISVQDLRDDGPVELFGKIAGALEALQEPQQRAAALVELFPNAAEGLEVFVAVLGQGRREFQSFLDATKFFGGSLSEESASAVGRLKTAFDALELSFGRVSRAATVAIAERVAPILERFATYFALHGERIGKAIGAIVAALVQLALAVGQAFVRLVAFLSSNGEKIIEFLEGIPLVGQAASKAMRDLFDTRRIEPGARKLRDELEELANAEQKLLRSEEDLRRSIAYEKSSGDSVPSGRLAAMNEELQRKAEERQQIFLRMTQVEAEFNAAQKRSGGQFQPDEIGRQRNAAEIRASADDLFDTSKLADMPGPFRELAMLLNQVFLAMNNVGDAGQKAAEKIKSSFDSFTDGFGAQLTEIREKWGDFAAAGREAASTIVDGGLNGLTDAFADIITGQKSAKEAFKDFARTMLGELAKIIAKLTIMKALQGLGFGLTPAPGLELGGVMPGKVEGTVPLRKFANGGVVKRPTLALFGEGKASRGEAFVPLPDGRRIPVALTGGGGGGVMNITIQAMDGADVQRVLIGNRGTLRALWSQDISRMQAVRQTVKGAVQ